MSSNRPERLLSIRQLDGSLHKMTFAEALQSAQQQLALGQTFPALHAADQILEVAPRDPRAHNLMVRCYLSNNAPEKAQLHLDRSLRLSAELHDTHFLQSQIYAHRNNHRAAISCLQRAISLAPKIDFYYSETGRILFLLGDEYKALKFYRKAIAINPWCHSAYNNLIRLRNTRFSEDELKIIDDMLTSGMDIATKGALYFSLSKHYEREDNTNKQMEALHKGNELMHSITQYRAADDDVSRFDIISGIFSENRIRELRKPSGGARLIFIIGFPRSGSTLTEKILSAHKKVQSAGESNLIMRSLMDAHDRPDIHFPYICSQYGKEEVEKVARSIRRLCEQFPRGAMITEKSLGNYTSIGLIKILLPDAKIVHVTKNAVDNCFGCYKQIFNVGQWPCIYNLEELKLFYINYHKVMNYWRSIFPGEIFHLEYEALIEDQEGVTRKLLEYCGLPWTDACLDFHEKPGLVRSTSSSQVRQKLYSHAVNQSEKYAEHLKPLLELNDLPPWV